MLEKGCRRENDDSANDRWILNSVGTVYTIRREYARVAVVVATMPLCRRQTYFIPSEVGEENAAMQMIGVRNAKCKS